MARIRPIENLPVLGRRLRESRLRLGLPQDKLGVMVGLDESTSSARISRYEGGVHEPPIPMARRLAEVLGVPVAYFYTADDELAELLLQYDALSKEDKLDLKRWMDKRLRKANRPA